MWFFIPLWPVSWSNFGWGEPDVPPQKSVTFYFSILISRNYMVWGQIYSRNSTLPDIEIHNNEFTNWLSISFDINIQWIRIVSCVALQSSSPLSFCRSVHNINTGFNECAVSLTCDVCGQTCRETERRKNLPPLNWWSFCMDSAESKLSESALLLQRSWETDVALDDSSQTRTTPFSETVSLWIRFPNIFPTCIISGRKQDARKYASEGGVGEI